MAKGEVEPSVFDRVRVMHVVQHQPDIGPTKDFFRYKRFDEVFRACLNANKLADLIPLKDKRVIEFGPFDRGQTAGLVNYWVGQLVCIDAREENFITTLIAIEGVGRSND